ncbi:hypothetical protein F511_11194 [Dorcoceras hygrometricum]|uniref:Uncharacterized protein n=1 Tax=Dorcoceras hygrometricum TaxID=472368 RepID=A0A2Z7D0Q8_9LAMI|nr:hypothetical protein F511_11194 [Dorcoceras hygrometricum]
METSRVESAVRNQARAKKSAGTCIEKSAEEFYRRRRCATDGLREQSQESAGSLHPDARGSDVVEETIQSQATVHQQMLFGDSDSKTMSTRSCKIKSSSGAFRGGRRGDFLLASMSEGVQAQMIGCESSVQLWTRVSTIFATHSKARVMHYKLQLQTLNKGNLSMKDYIIKIVGPYKIGSRRKSAAVLC